MSRVGSRLNNVAMLLLGTLMVFYGLSTGYAFLRDADTLFEYLQVISSVIMAVFGFAIIIDTNRTPLKTTVMFTFALGLYRTISYYLLIKDSLPTLEQSLAGLSILDYLTYITTIFYIVMFVFALLMFITAFAIALGFEFRRNSLMYTCFLMVAMDILRIWLAVSFGSWEDLASYEHIGEIIEITLFIIALWMFDSDAVRMRESDGVHMLRMLNIRNGVASDNARHIHPDVAEALLDPERRQWRTLMDCGPVLREFQFTIIGKEINRNIVLVQEWKNDPSLHITICGIQTVTVLFPNNYVCDAIFREGDEIIFAGRTGVNLVVPVRETMDSDRFGLFKEDN